MGIILEKEMLFIKIDNESGKLTATINGKTARINSISGHLLKIAKHSVNFEDEFVEKLDITLIEKEEIYQLSVGFNTNLAHTLLNMLASVPADIESRILKISSYKKNGFTKIFMLLNNEKVPWKYSPEELSAKEDKSQFFENLFYELEKRFAIEKESTSKVDETSEKEKLPF